MDKIAIVLIILLALLWAIGDIVYKRAMYISGKLELGDIFPLIKSGITDIFHLNFYTKNARVIGYIAISMTIAFICTLLLSIPLSRLEVSVVKPALNTILFVVLIFLGLIIYNEPLTIKKIAGVSLAIIGIWLLLW